MEELADGLNFVLTENIAKIFINSEINDLISQDFVDLLYGLEFINETTPINAVIISISSPGGSVISGMSMFSAIKMSSLNIVIINSGIVASIASVIFLGVEKSKRYAFSNSLFMIHNSHGGDNQDVMDKIDKSIGVVLASSINPLYIKELMDEQTWMNADEQVMYQVIDTQNIINVDEKFDLNLITQEETNPFLIYNNMKIIQNNMSKINIIEKLKTIFNKVENETVTEEVVVEEAIIETITEDVIEETVEETITEDVIEETISEIENIVEEELEEVIPPIVLNEVEALKLEVEALKLELFNIENSKIIEAKKSFLIENKITETAEIMNLDLAVIKNLVNSLKVNITAPIISNKITNGSEQLPKFSELTNEQKTDLAKNNIDLFLKIQKNK